MYHAVDISTKLLNSFNLSGLPPQKLDLKIGTFFTLMRKLNASNLCNEAKFRVLSIKYNIIETKILTDTENGQILYIPRISMITNEYLFESKPVKSPNNLSFTIAINKIQGHNESGRNRKYRTFTYSRTILYWLLSC